MHFSSVNEILDFAIDREVRAARMYTELANAVERPGIREACLEFAAEEGRHKARLMRVKAGDITPVRHEKIADLKIAGDLVEPTISKNMNYQEVLVFAMKSEKIAYQLYMRLAQATDDANLKSVFLDLAQEEAKHKLFFETEYDERILEGV